ncbi:efflux transporter periplasmic adaptor subunit [Methylocystis sp. MitZ-2018]|nr:efflux transporter periplasmic adaptor subunit [Methylocystis sp. MitZ-2018]
MRPFGAFLLLVAMALIAVGLVRGGRSDLATQSPASEGKAEAAERKAADGLVKVSPAQIEKANIEISPVGPGTLSKRLTVPAAVAADPDRIGRVAAKVAGIVAEMRKRIGDRVAANEVIAIIDSRELADAKSGFLAAAVDHDLQNTLFQREKGLFEKKITPEQAFLKAKSSLAEAKLRLDLARQKLVTLDMTEAEVSALGAQPIANLKRKEIRAPLAGRVIERLADIGQPVGGEGQAKELYVVADLSVVQVDLSVLPNDLPFVREGQTVSVKTVDGRRLTGKVATVAATVTRDTRSGRVLADFKNQDLALHPGVLLDAEIDLETTRVKLRAPRAAVQIIEGEPTVFVRTADGFVKRKIEIGASDDDAYEILRGLAPGEAIAVTNSFILKAEAGKNEVSED